MAPGRGRELRGAYVTWAERLAELEYEFHVRAFGEEMARINFLPTVQRIRELSDLQNAAIRRGVRLEKPARGVT